MGSRRPVATQVEHDGRQPRPEPEGPDPCVVIAGKRPIRPNQGVLGHLLGVVAVAEESMCDGVEAVLVGANQRLERAVEVLGEARRERVVGVHCYPEPLWVGIRCMRAVYGTAAGCDNPAMGDPDVFDDLLASLGGFYRSWLIYLGLELGLFEALRRAGDDGMTPAELATATGTHGEAVDHWAWAADAHQLAELEDGRLRVDPDVAGTLLDRERTDYLGGQFVHGVVATLDWDRMVDFFRTGTPVRDRPDRYRTAIERLTQQDIAVFFQEALAALPQAVAELSSGGRVVDIHCGGGRWLIAMARRFPRLELVGVEFEADSVARARQHVEEEGLGDRISIVQADVTNVAVTRPFDLAYFQYALHQLPDAVTGLRRAWAALGPGGRLVVLDWPLPTDPEEFRSRHGELIAGVQLDELYQGTSLATRDRFRGWFAEAGLPEPTLIDLPSGASLFVAQR
jgi:SAM-dependent methyltransferase